MTDPRRRSMDDSLAAFETSRAPKGAHARSAYGVAQLPLGACVEIELIAQVADGE